MSHTISTMEASTAGRFRYIKLAAAGAAKATLLVVQGRGEYIEKYTDIMEGWQAQGFDVVMPEWRGQGLSSRFLTDHGKAWLPSFDVFLDDLDLFFERQMKDAKQPIIIVAHSMGAHIALRWQQERNAGRYNVKGMALLSIMQDINTFPFPLGAAVQIAAAMNKRYSTGYAPLQKGFDPVKIIFELNMLTHDAARYDAMNAQMRDNPALKPGGVTWGWLHAALHSTSLLEQNLKLKPPAGAFLVLGSARDHIVQPNGIRRLATYLPGCKTHFYTPAHHELLQEAEPVRSDVIARITRFAEGLI